MTQITVLSLGGGLQSTVIAEMALDDDHPMPAPDWMVHSDTGAESEMTQATIARIGELCEDKGVNFAIVRNTNINLPIHEYYIEQGRIPMPKNAQCTMKFKIQPMNNFVQTLVDKSLPKPWVKMLIGITTDEAHRQREAERKYILNSYPLIEMGYSRRQCRNWMIENRPNVQVAKSGCFHCHYQGAKQWGKLAKEHPELFQIAREMEEGAKASGLRNWGLFRGRSIEQFNNGSVTLEDFGIFDMQPGDVDCRAEGGCFL
tara:strand:+ start:1160 stop:1936 length:777 start_codon:yes stop_codon:yes gene_type:complete